MWKVKHMIETVQIFILDSKRSFYFAMDFFYGMTENIW